MSVIISPNSRLYKLGRAHVYFAPVDASGLRSFGYYDLGDSESLNYTNKPTIEKEFQMMGGPASLSALGVSRIDGEVTIKGKEFSAENLALMYGGTASVFTQTTGSVAAEVITPAAGLLLGQIYKLAFRASALADLKISSTTLIAGPSGTGDYQVLNLAEGLVQINQVPSSTNASVVINGAAVTADYTKATITGYDVVSPATVNVIQGTLLVAQGPGLGNPYGVQQELILWNVIFEPDTGPDFIGDKFARWSVKANVVNDYASNAGALGGTSSFPVGQILFEAAA